MIKYNGYINTIIDLSEFKEHEFDIVAVLQEKYEEKEAVLVWALFDKDNNVIRKGTIGFYGEAFVELYNNRYDSKKQRSEYIGSLLRYKGKIRESELK